MLMKHHHPSSSRKTTTLGLFSKREEQKHQKNPNCYPSTPTSSTTLKPTLSAATTGVAAFSTSILSPTTSKQPQQITECNTSSSTLKSGNANSNSKSELNQTSKIELLNTAYNGGQEEKELGKQSQQQQHPDRSITSPRHIAFICDGNSRWAKNILQGRTSQTTNDRRLIPKTTSPLSSKTTSSPSSSIGHTKGATRVISTIQYLNHHHPSVKYITMYAFSTENWSRSNREIEELWNVMKRSCRSFSGWAIREKIVVKILGDLDDERIPRSLRNMLRDLEERTSLSSGRFRTESGDDDSSYGGKDKYENEQEQPLTFCIAINYGGRKDIINASLKMANLLAEGTLTPHDVTNDESILDGLLYTSGIPDPDLVIRTGGEQRLSNFLIWNCAYAELYFTDVLWPDFDGGELEKALSWYQKRDRRFGGRNDSNTVVDP